MPDLTLLKHLVCEVFSRRRSQREPEPQMLMDDPTQVAAFARAGREDGGGGQTYLLNSVQLCGLIHPGNTAVDTACGPATQLAQVAHLNLRADFLGIDLAPCMPDAAALVLCFAQIRRIHKPCGRVSLSNFGRLKRAATMPFTAHRNAADQSTRFTTNDHNSLHAAFTWPSSVQPCHCRAPAYVCFPRHWRPSWCIRSAARPAARTHLCSLWRALPVAQQNALEERRNCLRMQHLFIPALR